jgi:hypothetical protein
MRPLWPGVDQPLIRVETALKALSSVPQRAFFSVADTRVEPPTQSSSKRTGR